MTTDEITVEKRKRVNLSLSLETHRAIRVYCAQRGVTLQAGIEGMLDRAFAPRLDPTLTAEGPAP
jgi:hypothetical protein